MHVLHYVTVHHAIRCTLLLIVLFLHDMPRLKGLYGTIPGESFKLDEDTGVSSFFFAPLGQTAVSGNSTLHSLIFCESLALYVYVYAFL